MWQTLCAVPCPGIRCRANRASPLPHETYGTLEKSNEHMKECERYLRKIRVILVALISGPRMRMCVSVSECVSVCVCVFSGSLERDLGNTANSLSAKLMACVPLKTSSEEFDLVVNILMWVNLSIHILEHCAFFPLL